MSKNMISLYHVSPPIQLFSECSSVGKLGDVGYDETSFIVQWIKEHQQCSSVVMCIL